MPLQPPPMPNDIVASYTLEKSIGIGGNANVFLASSAERGKVAIKILHPGKTSQEDIKRAYRKLSLDLHPDRNKGDIQKEEQYKKITSAYNTLSDPNERAQYDTNIIFKVK